MRKIRNSRRKGILDSISD